MKLRTGTHVKPQPWSQNLVGWWKCDDAAGSVIKDYSGNGLDLSPLYAPRWKVNSATAVQRIITPTVANGFYYECTTAGTTTASGDPTAAFTTTPGSTATDGTVTWTCRAVPDFWSSRAGWLTHTAANGGLGLYAKNSHPKIFEASGYTVDGNVDWTSPGVTVTATASGNHIDDSASGFPTTLLAVGDWVVMSGWSTDTANDSIAKISAISTTQITFSLGGIANNEVARRIRMQKCAPPPSILFCWTTNSTQSTGNQVMFGMNEHWSPFHGNRFYSDSSRILNTEHFDWNGGTQTRTVAAPSGSSSSGVDTNFAIAYSFEQNLIETYKNGTRGTSTFGMTARNCTPAMAMTQGNLPVMYLLQQLASVNGVCQIKNVHLYIGRNIPTGASGVCSNATPSLLVTPIINTPAPLSATDWP